MAATAATITSAERPGFQPHRGESPLGRAQRLRAAGRSAEAKLVYAAVLDADPTQPDALLGLAALLMSSGKDGARAQRLLERCCSLVPDRAEAWDALGVSLVLAGDPAGAEAAFTEAERLAPAIVDYALHRAEAAHAAGDGVVALARLEAALMQDPLNAPALGARGLLAACQGDHAAATDHLEGAAALRPDSAAILVVLARSWASLQQPAKAEALLARAIALNPADVQARSDRAVMLLRMQRPAEACAVLLELMEEQGPQVGPLCNLANAYLASGEQDRAARAASDAIALAPDAHLPRRVRCNVLPYRTGTDGAVLLEAARAAAARLPRQDAPAWANTPEPDRALRLGLLSGSFKIHPVGWLTLAGFESLDPRQFEITCLAHGTAEDAMARRFRAVAVDWRDVSGLEDRPLADLARALGIDMLIDLGGYGEAGRMSACALRLAPVQMKWVGMQNGSSGMPEMDWFVTDRWETPPGAEPLYSERLLRLPDGYVCYSPPPDAPDVSPSPALANGFVTFGCFNNLAKITPAVVDTWACILREVPRSRLILKSHPFGDAATRERVQAGFAAYGVKADRLELQGASPHRHLLAEYGRVDLVLDPFPYCGGLTTCEALWMGVPVLTLAGDFFAARHSASHLCNVGLADWVAADRASYVRMAARRAADPTGLSVLRAGLRERVRSSPLCDGPRFGRNLGEALRGAWQIWCREAGSGGMPVEPRTQPAA